MTDHHITTGMGFNKLTDTSSIVNPAHRSDALSIPLLIPNQCCVQIIRLDGREDLLLNVFSVMFSYSKSKSAQLAWC